MEDLILEKIDFNLGSINNINDEQLVDFPVVYLLDNYKSKDIYIGETVQIKTRLKSHFKSEKKKVHNRAIIIGNDRLNKSGTLNIETNLINYFIADQKYKLQNVSQTSSHVMHNYYDKDYYDKQLSSEIWNKLIELDIAKSGIDDLRIKDIFKISPYKTLSQKQLVLKTDVLNFCMKNINSSKKAVYLIEGEAGTGKSVVLSSIFNTLTDFNADKNSVLYQQKSILLVNHEEMLKTYHAISRSLPNVKIKSIMKPTSFLNLMAKKKIMSDITIVDEAHLLLTMPDAYNSFKENNHLEEIIRRSKITIIIFDKKQSLKIKSMWNEKLLNEVVKGCTVEKFKLQEQFRINAGIEVINWIDSFVEKKILPLPKNDEEKFELKIFDDAQEMFEEIKIKNNMFKLSRVVATFDYLHKKDGKDYYVEEKDFKLPWNKTFDKNISWAEMNTINEVGSIYTIQGFDLNYVGVILGPSIDYDEQKDELVIDTTKYKDTGAFSGANNYPNAIELKERIILNSINVLMKRGVHGLYIYSANDKLRKKLSEI